MSYHYNYPSQHQYQPQQSQGAHGAQPSMPGQTVLPDRNFLYSVFQKVDTDNSRSINALELQAALSNGTWTPFNPETVRLMIGMFDRDCSGTIEFEEFAALWKYVTDWQNCFRSFDRDNSGSIDHQELQTALTSFGYRVSPATVTMMVKKFDRLGRGTGESKGTVSYQCCGILCLVDEDLIKDPEPEAEPCGLAFDDFIQCCVVLHTLTSAFRQYDTDQDGVITIHYEQFLQMVMGLKI